MLRIPSHMRTKKKIDDIMFTIVAIQNMLLDYSTAAQIHKSWTVQLDQQKVGINNHNGNTSLLKLLGKLVVAEQEYVDEEDDLMRIRPLVKRKKLSRRGHILYVCSRISSTIQVRTSPLSDFVDSAQASLDGVIEGYPLKMRQKDSDLSLLVVSTCPPRRFLVALIKVINNNNNNE